MFCLIRLLRMHREKLNNFFLCRNERPGLRKMENEFCVESFRDRYWVWKIIFLSVSSNEQAVEKMNFFLRSFPFLCSMWRQKINESIAEFQRKARVMDGSWLVGFNWLNLLDFQSNFECLFELFQSEWFLFLFFQSRFVLVCNNFDPKPSKQTN